MVARGCLEEGSSTFRPILTQQAQRMMECHGRDHASLHRSEIEQLKAVSLPEHVKDSEIVSTFRCSPNLQ